MPASDIVDRSCTLRAAICATTRNRSQMFQELLDSLAVMTVPHDVDAIFVFVENGRECTLDGIVSAFRETSGRPVVYEAEPTLGIPVARNTACDLAVREAADLVLFVDDDETVAQDWLEKIVDCYREGSAVLLGGPVLPTKQEDAPRGWQGMIRSGVEARYMEKARVAEARLRAGQQHKITVVTNNWLAEASLFTEHGLRFDERLRFTGGSDTQFFRDVCTKGLKTGWCPGAIVYETIPHERVSARYQFRRAMEQSRTSLHAKLRDKGIARATVEFVPVLLARSIALLGVAVSLPVTRGPGMIRLMRGAGWTAGRISGLLGARSRLYGKTTGS